MNCEDCHHSLTPEARFCDQCGASFVPNDTQPGHSSSIEINLRELFSQVFVKHPEEEGERLFLVGTSQTTPSIEEVLDSWPRPWLYARIFLFTGFIYVGLYIGFEVFDNAHFFPGLIMVGSFIVPLTILIFFWEMNAPQNISIYKIIKILFIGGIMSLITAVFFYKNIGDQTSVIMVGFVEELAKLLVIIWFIRENKYTYILNGILIGAAVGTGFAAFESAGYALMAVLVSDFDTMYFTIFWRGVLAPGGHIVWAALLGAAINIVRAEDRPLHLSMLKDYRFWGTFMIVVGMHAVWDLPWPILMGIPIAQLCLTVFSWVIAFVFINWGLKEITRLKKRKENQAHFQPIMANENPIAENGG
jgi:protease PrsW